MLDRFGVRWQLAEAKRSEDWSGAATPLFARPPASPKAAWCYASRRSPKIGCRAIRVLPLSV
jgi:hypothetical protein